MFLSFQDSFEGIFQSQFIQQLRESYKIAGKVNGLLHLWAAGQTEVDWSGDLGREGKGGGEEG